MDSLDLLCRVVGKVQEIVRLLHGVGARVVLVFDGQAPIAKLPLLEKRQR